MSASRSKNLKSERGDSRITLTRELAFASGQTLIDIRLQQRAGKRWTVQDRVDGAAKTNSLLLYVSAEHGGLAGFTFSHTMMQDLGVTAEQVLASGNRIVGHGGISEREAA